MKTYIKDIRIIDGKSSIPIENGYVLLNNKYIEYVSDKPLEENPTYKVIDGNGKTLLPGLIDTHVHLSGDASPNLLEGFKDPDSTVTLRAISNAKKTLTAGFTMVRNLGEKSYIDVQLAHSIEKKENDGPRVITAGRGISVLGGHGTPAIREVCGANDARLAVREHIKAGVNQIKIIASGGILTENTVVGASQMTKDELHAIADEAKSNNKPVSAHAHGEESIRNCIEVGVKSIEHCSLPNKESMELMAKQGIYMVPTFVAGKMINQYGKKLGINQKIIDKSKKIEEIKSKKFEDALKAGVKVAMGTDASTPFNYHGENAQELSLMVDAGMSPMNVIIASTKHGAELCGLDEKTGTIETGKYADILLVKQNPLENIKTLQSKENIFRIFKEGERII